MRKLGIIGGMSWISTRTYYQKINQQVQRRVAPRASAPLLIESLDYRSLGDLAEDESWSNAANVLSESARRLEAAGAQGLLIAANVMHRVYDEIASAVDIPVLHIADCIGERMQAAGASNAALLGTRLVMTENFFRRRLVAHGIDLLPPDMENLEKLDRTISEELKLGKATRDAERLLKTIMTRYEQSGAESVILACTELELVVDVKANVLPIFDAAQIHCDAAVEWLLQDEPE
ncbi:aspartate/glutamate racemase family protein [Altererythrobacter sp. MF3-039]|uniref:aspartate/glutamate racemase family protein n=1 Tax=Altererythrobacter sp. MF3-039 TaxID=3252901 RepID=UPI00390CBD5E